MSSTNLTPTGGSRRQVFTWILWDVGSSSFDALMTTFIFTVYLTSAYFGPDGVPSQALTVGLTIAGFLIAALAPVTGQRSDRSGRGIFWLGFNTFALVALMALCVFVRPTPDYLWLGVLLISAANVFSEFAVVNYNAVLPRIATSDNIGKISGAGWAAGYFGGILALLVVLYGFVKDDNFLHLATDDAFNIRMVSLFAAAWGIVFCLPVLITMRRRDRFLPPVLPHKELKFIERGLNRLTPGKQGGIIASYRELGRTIARLHKASPQTLYFLVASAIFRDGLVGIFTFGGILAATSFGFTQDEVIIFGIAASAVAGVGAAIGGYLDDSLGPKKIIIISLVCILITSVPLLLWQSTAVFWVCALILCLFVGPAQSASRTFLARIAEPGTEGELFGLYSTTGRAASFLAPAFFGLFISIFGKEIWGVLGIMLVIVVGLVLLLPIESPGALHQRRARRQEKKEQKAAAKQ